MKKNFINKNCLALLITASISPTVFAQSSVPALQVPKYTDAQLMSQGCSPAVWARLVNDYQVKRGSDRDLQTQIQVVDQAKTAPSARGTSGGSGPSSGASCFDSAINNINGAVTKVNALMSIFSGGGVDFGSLGGAIKNQLTQAACNQINSYTGNVTSNVLTPVNGQLNTVNNTISGGVPTNSTVGNIRVQDHVIKGNTNTIPTVSQTGVNQTTSQTTGSFWNSVTSTTQKLNPFK